MTKKTNTPSTSWAINLWSKKFVGDPVAFPAMSEPEFNTFLQEASEDPMDTGEWRKPIAVELPEGDLDFERVEYFQTPKGPVCAAYGKDDFSVYVAADRRLAIWADHKGGKA